MNEEAPSSFEQLLAEVVDDPVLNDGYALSARAVTRDYLILFNGRSGSTWLTALLTNRFGVPDEYLNPAFIAEVARAVGATTRDRLLSGVRGKTNSAGVFGIEATSEHLARFGEDAFFGHFPSLVVFNLWRDNLVAQAISLFRAVATGHFHSGDGPRPTDPAYDGDQIAEWFEYLAQIENDNFMLLARRGLKAIPLVYETMIGDPEGTLATFRRVLGVAAPDGDDGSEAVPLPRKVTARSWAAEVEARFRADHAGTVANAYERRLAPPLGRVGR